MKDLREWIDLLEKEGVLLRIKAEVDYDLELGHVATLNERKNGPALLFENVRGHNIPVLISTITTPKKLALTCGLPADTSICNVAKEWMRVMVQKRLVPPVEVKDNIPVMEQVIEEKDVNLLDLPSPRLYPKDGGRYLGLAFNWVTQDPETGWTNIGTYRGQLLDEKNIGANMWIKSKHGYLHMEKTRKQGKSKMLAAAYCGCDMIHFLTASNMVPEGMSEYDVIGGIMNDPVQVFRSDYTGLMLPANAEIILEGEVELEPKNFRPEGPLGEYPGFYGASGAGTPKPFFTVKRILRRKEPIFVASTVGRPVGDTHIANTVGRTAFLWADLEMMKVPGIRSVYMPPEAAGRWWAIVSAKCTFPAQAQRIAHAVLASPTGHFHTKGVIVVDEDVAADDLAGVWWSLAVRYSPVDDTQIINKIRATPFDPALPEGAKDIGSAIILDCTTPVEWQKKPLKVEDDPETMEKVLRRWQEYGFSGR